MLNDIPTRQNLPEFIDRVCASSQTYDTVKSMSMWQTRLALSAAIIGTLVAFVFPDGRGWSALYAAAILIIDIVFLERWVNESQALGAKIQEVFDTELYGIGWNSHRCGDRPDVEDVKKLASQFKVHNEIGRLRDWYPVEVGDLPIEYARLICQRSNMKWDAELRRHYSASFIVLLVVMVVGSGAIALLMKWDAAQIAISLVLPLLPSGLKLFRECRKHTESAAASDRTKKMLEAIWKRGLTEKVTPDEFKEESRRLQDELYDRRKLSPTVPQRIYLKFREEYEKVMKYGAAEMVKDAKAKLGIP